MQNIAIVYGGQSTEHDVSILTGLHLARHITDDYRVTLVYLTKDNQFVYGSHKIDDYISGKASRAKIFKRWDKIACVVNCCHGGAGEDGTLAAVLKFYDLPVTSCPAISAWQQQSKIATREKLTAAGFAQPRYQVLTDLTLSSLKLPLPVVVKPDLQGSSIGVAVAHNQDELRTAVKTALGLGSRVIVEELVTDMQEVNIAVMRHDGKIITSGLELVGNQQFFSFADKYYNTDSGFMKKGTASPDDAFLAKVAPRIEKLAVVAYELFGSRGVVRSDFMVKGDQIILNENNTVPGFMAYHLWLKKGIPYGVVIDDMIQEAIHDHQNEHFVTNFDSEILVKNRQLVLEI